MKIAFCFLTYDNIIRNDVWNNFFENVDKNKYMVYIHPKNIINISNNISNYNFNYHILNNRINTVSKTDINIVKATIRLFEEACNNDKDLTHFIFLSQSCIPLYNFDKIYLFLKKVNKSIISCIKGNKIERYFQLSLQARRFIKQNQFVKQQPNMILIRDDVLEFINIDYTTHFQNMICPDEHFFVNILLNILKKDCIKMQTHFCNPDLNKTQALEYKMINNLFIDKLRNLGFLFIRKVNNGTIIDNNYLLT